jgi:hypothetical protein
MEWYRSNKNGLHYFFYKLCNYCKRHNIHIIKDNNSFRDFVELTYAYSSGKQSNSKFDVIAGLPRKYRSLSKALSRYKKRDEPEKEEKVVTIPETIQLVKEDDVPKVINHGNKLTDLYMDTETLYRKAHEKMRDIEKTNKYMRVVPQWIFVQIEYETT